MSNEIQARPAHDGVAITKSDTVPLTRHCDAIYVGGAGDVAVITAQGTVAVTFSGMAAGTILPVRCKQVMSTNTTATNLVGLFY